VVVSANPAVNASNVPLNAAISLQTNAAIDPTTVNTSTFGVYDNVLAAYVSGTYSFNSTGTIVYFVPSAPLATGRTYTVNFYNRGMTDLIGNLIGTCCSINNFSFTTGVVSSTTGPQVTGVSPASGLAQVPINAQVVIQFNEPVDVQSLSQITLSAGGAPVNVSSYLTSGNQTFMMIPLGTLSPNTAYTVTIAGVTDISGIFPINPMVTSSFSTGTGVDFVTPAVTSATPANGATGVARSSAIQVQFNKQMDPLTITNSTFVVSVSGGGIVSGTVSVAAGARSATFTPQTALSPSSVYVVQLNGGVTDLVGQGLASYQISFTTGN
jgi:methionine-rich copper-binding protein CopC